MPPAACTTVQSSGRSSTLITWKDLPSAKSVLALAIMPALFELRVP
jgi:hypothetical protein